MERSRARRVAKYAREGCKMVDHAREGLQNGGSRERRVAKMGRKARKGKKGLDMGGKWGERRMVKRITLMRRGPSFQSL